MKTASKKTHHNNHNIHHLDYEEFKHKIQWLYKGRIITIVPCVLLYLTIASLGKFLPNTKMLFSVVLFELFFNTPYDFLIKKFYNAKKENLLILLMLSMDVFATTLALYIVGLRDTFFFGAIYLITITFAGILATNRIAYFIATLSAVCYGSISFFSYKGFLKDFSNIGVDFTSLQSTAWVLSHILFFYITAYLTNFYSSPLKLLSRDLYDWGKSLEKRLYKGHAETIQVLLKALKAKDPYTEIHSHNVAWYSILIAKKMNLAKHLIKDFKDACFLHDIGKIGIEDCILTKNSSLSPEEWKKIKLHPEFGSEIITALSGTENVAQMIIQEHEHFDGSGYPKGLKGDEICLGAQIIAVADAFDVLVSGRPYREPIHPDRALEIIKADRGKYFSPEVVDCFYKIYTDNKNNIHWFIEHHKINRS